MAVNISVNMRWCEPVANGRCDLRVARIMFDLRRVASPKNAMPSFSLNGMALVQMILLVADGYADARMGGTRGT